MSEELPALLKGSYWVQTNYGTLYHMIYPDDEHRLLCGRTNYHPWSQAEDTPSSKREVCGQCTWSVTYQRYVAANTPPVEEEKKLGLLLQWPDHREE